MQAPVSPGNVQKSIGLLAAAYTVNSRCIRGHNNMFQRKIMLLFCQVRFCLSQCIDIEIYCDINNLYDKTNFHMFPN